MEKRKTRKKQRLVTSRRRNSVIIRIIAKIYIFFVVFKRKPRYIFAFMGVVAAIVAAIILLTTFKNSNSTEVDPTESLRENYTYTKVETEKEMTKDNDEGSNISIDDARWNEAVWQMEKDADEKLWYGSIHVDIDALRNVSPDIIGWIYFEAANISYPVLFSGDDDTYLRATYNGEYETAGSIFLEGENASDFSDKHILIYGHNMKNETMFGQLKLYKRNRAYYKNHQYFQLIYKDEITGEILKERYHIFAGKDVSEDDDVYYVFDKNYDNISEFASKVIIRGNYLDVDEREEVDNNDKIITLSTCSSGDNRFVLSAVKCSECRVSE